MPYPPIHQRSHRSSPNIPRRCRLACSLVLERRGVRLRLGNSQRTIEVPRAQQCVPTRPHMQHHQQSHQQPAPRHPKRSLRPAIPPRHRRRQRGRNQKRDRQIVVRAKQQRAGNRHQKRPRRSTCRPPAGRRSCSPLRPNPAQPAATGTPPRGRTSTPQTAPAYRNRSPSQSARSYPPCDNAYAKLASITASARPTSQRRNSPGSFKGQDECEQVNAQRQDPQKRNRRHILTQVTCHRAQLHRRTHRQQKPHPPARHDPALLTGTDSPPHAPPVFSPRLPCVLRDSSLPRTRKPSHAHPTAYTANPKAQLLPCLASVRCGSISNGIQHQRQQRARIATTQTAGTAPPRRPPAPTRPAATDLSPPAEETASQSSHRARENRPHRMQRSPRRIPMHIQTSNRPNASSPASTATARPPSRPTCTHTRPRFAPSSARTDTPAAAPPGRKPGTSPTPPKTRPAPAAAASPPSAPRQITKMPPQKPAHQSPRAQNSYQGTRIAAITPLSAATRPPQKERGGA